MPDNYYHPDDPTKPVGPRQPQGQSPQGKLVIGSFQNQPQSPQSPQQRRPYQYPSPPQQPPRGAPSWQQAPGAMPPTAAPPRGNSSYQAGQMVGNRPSAKKRRNGCLITTLVVLALVIILGSVVFTTAQRVLAFGTKISTQPPLSTQTNYMNISDRTNLLVMGYGGGNHDGAYLTDSLLMVSIMPQSHHTSLISIPRDLWVQVPGSGGYGKINAVYEYASNFGKDSTAGGNAVAAKVATVTGMNVKYWMSIDFTGFRELIDSLGGVDVYVPDSFNACYPKNDDATKDASWIKAQFNKGMQHMDGATAIMYARAREPLEVCGMGTSENQAELTDFGRSARQQIIVKAVLAKVKQVSTWPKFSNAMTALEQTIRTNLSLADLAEFTLKMDMNDPKTAHIGLSTSNVLESDASYNLHPQNGDWTVIPPYIQKNLYN